HSPLSRRAVNTGYANISEGIVGVFVDCLLEVGEGFIETLFGLLAPVELSQQIQLIGFRVVSVMFRQLLLFFARQLQRQLTGYPLGEGTLQLKYLTKGLVTRIRQYR